MFAADLVDNEDSPAFAAGFSDDGKLGYEFSQLMIWKRLTSVLGISQTDIYQ